MDGSFNVTMQPFRALVATWLWRTTYARILDPKFVDRSCNRFNFAVCAYQYFGRTKRCSGGKSSTIGHLVVLYWRWNVITVGYLDCFRTKNMSPKIVWTERPRLPIVDQCWKRKKSVDEKLKNFIGLFTHMPPMMIKLAVVQFFSWFALYLMWVYTTSAVAQHVYGLLLAIHLRTFQSRTAGWFIVRSLQSGCSHLLHIYE